jgi:hypothetical protein
MKPTTMESVVMWGTLLGTIAGMVSATVAVIMLMHLRSINEHTEMLSTMSTQKKR